MSIEIKAGQYMGGMPVFDHRIVINGVTIGLSNEDFAELTEKLHERIGADYKKALEVYKLWDKGVDTAREFTKEIIDVFWIVKDETDWLIKRQERDINHEKLSEVLEKYMGFLGIE